MLYRDVGAVVQLARNVVSCGGRPRVLCSETIDHYVLDAVEPQTGLTRVTIARELEHNRSGQAECGRISQIGDRITNNSIGRECCARRVSVSARSHVNGVTALDDVCVAIGHGQPRSVRSESGVGIVTCGGYIIVQARANRAINYIRADVECNEVRILIARNTALADR